MTMENDTREPLSQNSITTPNLDVDLYGDGQDIIVAVGKGPNSPHTFNGLCDRPCGVAFRDRNNYFDLTGRANIKLTTMISGFHLVRPIIKLPDGTVLIGDVGVGSPSDFQPAEISFRDLRWFKLDPKRGVTLGGNWVQPDLSKVDEVGYFDVIPGSGERVEGMLSRRCRLLRPADGSSFRISNCGASPSRAKLSSRKNKPIKLSRHSMRGWPNHWFRGITGYILTATWSSCCSTRRAPQGTTIFTPGISR